MGLVTLDLPQPRQMRGRWAAFAAVCAARGRSAGCRADGPVWHYDDGGGNWADLHHVGAGRAVLIGHDHEYSDTYYGPAAEYFQEPETDLLADAPAWWEPPVRAAVAAGVWVGFAYGFSDGSWQRAPYDLDDGFVSLAIPAADEQRCRDLIVAFTRDAPGGSGADLHAVDELVAADADVTLEQVAAVVGPHRDAVAGVAAARAFLDV